MAHTDISWFHMQKLPGLQRLRFCTWPVLLEHQPVCSLGARTLQIGVFPNWTTNISKSSSITKFNTIHFASEHNQEDLILTSCPALATLSRTKRTIWWHNGSYNRKKECVLTNEKVINLTEYGLRRWRYSHTEGYSDVLTFKGHLSGPVYSLGFHFHHLILEPGMISRENFERIVILCVSWAVLADKNSWKCLTWSCIPFSSYEIWVVYKWKFCARMDPRAPLAGLWPNLAKYPSAVLTVVK